LDFDAPSRICARIAASADGRIVTGGDSM